MSFSNKEIQVYIVGFDVEKMSPFAKIEKIPSAIGPEQTKVIHTVLDCEGIDIVDYNDDIAIVVSDRGMVEEGTPIFEVTTPDNTVLRLAGTLLFAKNVYTDDSVDLGELSSAEIHDLVGNLKITVIGAVKG
ncbi:hypothetical protein A1A1_13817 [Planococcus antarcticus DSM 14505]|uniref:Uncharacterized protein n=1 Tax=Planococcus antarcticus DSM 14505 TaxID=1185653 RepID=A0AA87ILY3_9BACL|nr:hypothetical protein [Planococcus antarcticus]EIM05903.1 hypothetical protein A1A1_13817 [Planococcus antarcticus DSM 14505]